MPSRKVPVPKPRNASGGMPRAVSRPGVNSDGGPGFQSPFQPPPAYADLAADAAALLDPDAWQVVHAGGTFWRVRTATPAALALLSQLPDLKGGEQVTVINRFIGEHMHPDDFATLLERMVDPEDSFGADEYQDLYRQMVTVGTARPFWQSSDSPAQPHTTGVRFAQSWQPGELPIRFTR